MAKTAADRMRQYRAKLSEDQQKIIREKNRTQQRKCRSTFDIAKKEVLKLKNNLQKRVKRTKTRKHMLSKSFYSPQSLGKATSRIKRCLPNSPMKKVAVVKQLAEQFGLLVQKDQVSKTHLSDSDRQKVKDFFLSESVSYQLPGKKDFVNVVSTNNEKIKLQKKILILTVSEAHALFVADNTDIKIGKSTFAKLRPANVLPISAQDHTVCCCIYHENYELLVHGIKKVIGEFPDYKTILETTVCSLTTEQCHLGLCEICCDVNDIIEALFGDINDDIFVTYYQWDDNSKKTEHCDDILTIKKKLVDQTMTMRRHVFVSKNQLKQIEKLKKNLDETEIVLQEDFAENYAIKQQNEIMTAYWVSTGVTVFTAVINSQKETYSYAVVSNSLKHDKYSVIAFNKAILSHAESHGISFEKIHIFSDGAGSQFKNRFALSMIKDPQILHPGIKSLDWSFFGTAHGKGPVDGVGGTVKRAIWRRVLRKSVVINDAKEFSTEAERACPNITVLYVDDKTIHDTELILDDHWKLHHPNPIPETRANHFFEKNKDGEIGCLPVSNFVQTNEPVSSESVSGQPVQPVSDQPIIQSSILVEIEHQQLTKSSIESFETDMSHKHLQLNGNTPMDGNCLFSAVAMYVNKDAVSVTAQQLRSKAINNILNKTAEEKYEIAQFIEGTFEDYVSKMEKNGTYADHIAIKCLSDEIKTTIVIHRSYQPETVIGNSKNYCHVGYLPDISHYVALCRKVAIQTGQCYAVDYVDQFFLGFVLDQPACGYWKMKFLRKSFNKAQTYFYWPMVSNKHIVTDGHSIII